MVRSVLDVTARRIEHMRHRRPVEQGRHTSARRAYEQLRVALRSGRWTGEGDAGALTEQELVQELGASRNSVRRALQMLAAQGMVTRQTKVGTRPTATVLDVPVQREAWWPESAATSGPIRMTLDAQALVGVDDPGRPREFDRASTVRRLEFSGRDSQSELFVRIVHLADADAALGRTAAMPSDGRPDRFLDLFGAEVGAVRSTLWTVPAAPAVAAALGIPTGSAVLALRRTILDAHGTVRECATSLFRADRVALSGEG